MNLRQALPRIGIVAAAIAALAFSASAAGYRLAPYKDDLFDYPGVIETAYGGDYVKVDYSREPRPLRARHRPGEAGAAGICLARDQGRRARHDARVRPVSVKYIATGKVDGGAKAIVLYVHGRNGNRFQGANDGMFGGNFNRIKNLMVRNGGVYLSPRLSRPQEQGPRRGQGAHQGICREVAGRADLRRLRLARRRHLLAADRGPARSRRC